MTNAGTIVSTISLTGASVRWTLLTDVHVSSSLFVGLEMDWSVDEGKGIEKYKLIFKCRVKPNKVRIPKEHTEYYIMNKLEYIRPYRFLLKKIPK